ncbi:hypothetical protein FA13DRAFT_709820 [Coprinellus micaceus]|uniref:Uncharacterized protein n=1 Tax=Coprinellus micaceus TaxID=71717 RepID=A0A4Y7TUL9_COPMI|nr:hypothetical protein FA13DRAFT_709820 [Coprinellus micaceus]
MSPITSFQTLTPNSAICSKPEGGPYYDFTRYQNYDLQGLVGLCEANAAAREELVGGGWTSLWEEKRVQYGAPDCLGRLSEAEWALFLMGTTCQKCGTADEKVEIDFFLFKRLCSTCRIDGVITYVEACKQDSLRIEALNYINFTPCPAEGTPRIKARWFWREDVAWVSDAWRERHVLIEEGHPGANQNLDTFKEHCLTNVMIVQQNAPLWRDWYLIDLEKKFGRHSGEMIRRQELAKIVRPRFYKTGRFDTRDINRTIGEESKDLRTALPFRCDLQKLIDNEKRMATLYSRLAESVEATRRIRLNLITQERLSIVMVLWQAWVATFQLPVIDTWGLPGRSELSRHPLIASLLASDSFPTHNDYKRLERHFQGSLTTLFRQPGMFFATPSAALLGSIQESADVLEFATSVFTPHFATFQAKNHPIIVGWKAHSGWRHTPDRTSVECDFDPWLSHVSKGLLDLCNLPETATVEDMDREDQRFVCDLCYKTAVDRLGPAAHGIAKSVEAEVFTWRLALSHAYAVHQHDRDALEFSLLVNYGTWSFNALKEVKIAEDLQRTGQGQDPEATRVWLCNHCTEGPSRGAPTTLNNIIKHVRKEHVKAKEVTHNDYFIHEGLRLQYERLNTKIPLPVIPSTSTNGAQSAETRTMAQ